MKTTRRFIQIINITIFIIVFAFCNSTIARAESCSGTVLLNKIISPQTIDSGDPVHVTINISGCTGTSSTPIPFDSVLLIDQSGSMSGSDPTNLRLDAAKQFVNCAPQGSNIALVTFSDQITTVQTLTTDKNLLLSQIDSLQSASLGNETHMYDGMQDAQQILTDIQSIHNKFIILLTDGAENSSGPQHSALDFQSLVRVANLNNIVYLTVGLGPYVNEALLLLIANEPLGDYSPSPTPSDLSQIYQIYCTTASTALKTRSIVLNEAVSSGSATMPSVRILPNSVTSDMNLTVRQISTFVQSGNITIPIGVLGSTDSRSLSFDITSDCIARNNNPNENTVMVNTDDSSSNITYVYGNTQGVLPLLNLPFTCRKTVEPKVVKSYDPNTSILKIDITSRYAPGSNLIIKDIEILDAPSSYFQADISSATPSLAHLFPTPEVDALLWKIAELNPGETKTVAVKLIPIACSSTYHSPIDVDAEKYSGQQQSFVRYRMPDGTISGQLITNILTSLPLVDECDGRPDLYIEPAYSIWEFIYPELANIYFKYVLPESDSKDIWVDSAHNGLWDGQSTNNIPIESATSGPRPETIEVLGQGDRLYVREKNIVYVRITNTSGYVASGTHTVRLLFYNFDNSSWESLFSTQTPTINAGSAILATFSVPENTVTQRYIRPYRITPNDIIRLIKQYDATLASRIKTFVDSNPSLSARYLSPGEFAQIVPPSLRTYFVNFIQQHPEYLEMAWGKSSIRIGVSVDTATLEKHSHNNNSEEILIVVE